MDIRARMIAELSGAPAPSPVHAGGGAGAPLSTARYHSPPLPQEALMTALDNPVATKYPNVQNYIAGEFIDGKHDFLDVTNPADGSVISRVPLSASVEVDRAVDAAKKAFPVWSGMPIKERVQVFFKYKTLLEKNIDELSALVTEENGK